MKKRTKLLIYTCLCTLATTIGCKDMLDITPVHSMKPETINDYESILMGGYPRVDFFVKTELMTDNAMVNLNSTYKPAAAEEPWFLFASSHQLDSQPADSYWGQLYKTIFYCNTVLDKLEEITRDEQNKVQHDALKGEALALRSFAYFYLINMYADIYSPENLELPGVPMPLNANDVNEYSGDNIRTPLGEVWHTIDENLKEAANLLKGKTNNDRHRLNITTVQLLRARVALFKQEWEKAANLATEVMASAKLSNLNALQSYIDDASNVKYAFSGNVGFIDSDYNKEVLFFTGGRANNNIFYYSQSAFKPTEELLDLTKRNGELVDYRQYIFDSFEDVSTSDGIMIGKTVYNMFATQEKNWYYIGFKASEAYVIRAEAYARQGKFDLAIGDINDLLSTRYKKDKFQPLKQTDFTDTEDILIRILEERRLETALDGGLRFFDLRRLGKPEIKHIYKNGQEFILKKNDPKYILQIPLSEINNSPDMVLNPR